MPIRPNMPLISLENVSFYYEKENPIIVNLNLSLFGKQKIVIVGRNGCGKSTLMQLIDQTLSPSCGLVRHEPLVKCRTFFQHSIEKLRESSTFDLTPIELLAKNTSDTNVTEEDIRKHLSRFGIRNELASKTPLRLLSGGQAVRVSFSLCTWPTSPQVLLLDEPTNRTILNFLYIM